MQAGVVGGVGAVFTAGLSPFEARLFRTAFVLAFFRALQVGELVSPSELVVGACRCVGGGRLGDVGHPSAKNGSVEMTDEGGVRGGSRVGVLPSVCSSGVAGGSACRGGGASGAWRRFAAGAL